MLLLQGFSQVRRACVRGLLELARLVTGLGRERGLRFDIAARGKVLLQSTRPVVLLLQRFSHFGDFAALLIQQLQQRVDLVPSDLEFAPQHLGVLVVLPLGGPRLRRIAGRHLREARRCVGAPAEVLRLELRCPRRREDGRSEPQRRGSTGHGLRVIAGRDDPFFSERSHTLVLPHGGPFSKITRRSVFVGASGVLIELCLSAKGLGAKLSLG